MKARVIKDIDKNLKLLCEDGSIANCTDSFLYSFFVDFKKNISFINGKEGRWDIYPDMNMYPGETVAFIVNQQLVINDIEPFKKFFDNEIVFRKFISVDEYAKKHSVSHEIVKVHCRNGRIKGARKVGRAWIIPENAEYPDDRRKRQK